VDVVLNSLAGVAMVKSMEILAPFGHFVEIGKRDQYEGSHVSLQPFLRGLTMSSAHLDVLMIQRPTLARRIMLDVWAEVHAGRLPTLPSKLFPISELRRALRYMSEGTHIGKILVSMRSPAQRSPGEHATDLVETVVGSSHVVCGALSPATAWIALRTAESSAPRESVLLLVCPGVPGGEKCSDNLALQASLAMLQGSTVQVVTPTSIAKAKAFLSSTQHVASLVHLAVGSDSLSAAALAQVLHEVALTPRTRPLQSFLTLAPALGGLLSASCISGAPGAATANSRSRGLVALHARLHALAAARVHHGMPAAGCLCVDVAKLYEGCTQWHASEAGEEKALLQADIQRMPVAQLWPALMRYTASLSSSMESTEGLAPQEMSAPDLTAMLMLEGSKATELNRGFRGPLRVPGGREALTGRSIGALLRECITLYIAEHMGVEARGINLQQPVAAFGLDSLSLIGLASQLRVISPGASVVDMMEHETIEAFITHVAGVPEDEEGPQQQVRLLVLHGFRTSREIFELQMQPVLAALRAEAKLDCECTFVQAPHKARGPGDPNIPEAMELYEWYGEWGDDSNKEYIEAWRGPRNDGVEESLTYLQQIIQQQGPFHGVVGFSQGAAMAGLLLAQQDAQSKPASAFAFELAVLFSGVGMPSPLVGQLLEGRQIAVPSMHVYDTGEDFVEEMVLLRDSFQATHERGNTLDIVHHSEGHVIPKDTHVCGQIAAFIANQVKSNQSA